MEQTFGERLKKYRKETGMTQQELGERIGVSDKTVSRWESDGGYPDVTALVPLARALGVTVDDLLDGKRPVRTLTRTDYQNLLSFAFALGGGVLYFLLDLFVPMPLCYLAYLGCLAYGVYLQKYYAYQSRWFLLGEGVVNLGVNLSVVGGLLAMTAGLTVGVNIYNQGELWRRFLFWCVSHFGMTAVLCIAGALAVTASTQYLVWKKGFDGVFPAELSQGHGEPGHIPVKVRLCWGAPRRRQLWGALVPLLAGCFWLPPLWDGMVERRPELAHGNQEALFGLWLVVLAVLVTVLLMKRGLRRWIFPAWVMTAACCGMTGLQTYPYMWSAARWERFPYLEQSVRTGQFVALGRGSWGTLLLALLLAGIWAALCCLHLKAASPEGEGE